MTPVNFQAPDEPRRRPGKIVTFYSYKGGTGRSMAVANVAWILASQQRRVLVVDWDFEAPGLHRYFHPFLEDPEVTASPGLIDYFYDVVAAAKCAADAPADKPTTDKPWWHEWTSWLRYTYPLDTRILAPANPAEPKGRIDFVPAGRQTSDYGDRVSAFDWRSFYERLGGGVLLEAVKQRLRASYDYIIIDSRTGLSDTSGICTVQMPDDLVVCFTLNKQSMYGASAIARSAAAQRKKAEGTNGLRIWPVPTRIELNERDRLEAARTLCRRLFWQELGPLLKSRQERSIYWGSVEVLYQPFFAYEEVLAVFAERKHQTSSMLSSFEALIGRFSDGDVTELAAIDSKAREQVLDKYLARRKSPRQRGRVYVSYPHKSATTMQVVNTALRNAGVETWVDVQDILPGDRVSGAIEEGLAGSSVLISLLGREAVNESMRREIRAFVAHGKPVIPVLIEGADAGVVPPDLSDVYALKLSPSGPAADLATFVDVVLRVLDRSETPTPRMDPEDPQKGRWGGTSLANMLSLSALVTPRDGAYFDVELTVSAITLPLQSNPSRSLHSVVFHLHPTFQPSVQRVTAVNGVALLHLLAWGAFTVGAVADDGTELELDLSTDTSAPEVFRAR